MILSVKNVSKVYGMGENAVQALKNVNFEMEQGEFVALQGTSGSGKSTLLHLIGGL
ncbi:MAG: ATP-binding cassette domain-containing protein, partial [Lachnospiraceae bacterium]|nr:ATP-binding cassette domain-containing protein [Lachnospiraceae bacterium]